MSGRIVSSLLQGIVHHGNGGEMEGHENGLYVFLHVVKAAKFFMCWVLWSRAFLLTAYIAKYKLRTALLPQTAPSSTSSLPPLPSCPPSCAHRCGWTHAGHVGCDRWLGALCAARTAARGRRSARQCAGGAADGRSGGQPHPRPRLRPAIRGGGNRPF